MFAGNTKEAQTMQDRRFEPAHFGKVRIDMQRIPIAAKTIQCSLFLGRFLVDDDIGSSGGRFIRRGSGPTIRALGRPAEAATAADEQGHLVVEEIAAGLGVLGGGAVDLDGGAALVDDFDEARVVGDGGGGRDRVLADLEVLFAVQEHHRREVGHQLVHVPGRAAAEAGDYAEGGEDLEVVAPFVYEGEVGAFGAEAEVCGGERLVVVSGLGEGWSEEGDGL